LLQKATNIVDEFINNQPERMEICSKWYYDTILRTLTRIVKRYYVNCINKLSTESTPMNWANLASGKPSIIPSSNEYIVTTTHRERAGTVRRRSRTINNGSKSNSWAHGHGDGKRARVCQ